MRHLASFQTPVLCVLTPNSFKLVFKLDHFTEYFLFRGNTVILVGPPGLRSGVFGVDQTNTRLLLSDISPDFRGAELDFCTTERGFRAKWS